MSKQKKNKQSNQLSPENYIRQRARNLPIYKCWINKDWKSTKIATIFISRQHISGNLTFGVYIVDLLCLGVKETMFRHNVPGTILSGMHSNSKTKKLHFMELSYKLAHNIIYTAIEYAEEYGFHPVPEFTRITQYILEEDTEAIPLMHINCGDENGKPLYVNTGSESPAKEKQILARLEETAGQGNYRYVLQNDAGKIVPDKTENIDNEKLMDFFRGMDEEELKTRFLDLSNKIDSYDDEEENDPDKKEVFKQIHALSNVIIESMVEDEEVFKFVDVFKEKFDFKVIELFDIPNSYFIGLQCDDVEKFTKKYIKTIKKLLSDNSEQMSKKFRKEYGDVPFISYLELVNCSRISNEKYEEKLNECLRKYPNYLMFRIFQCSRDSNSPNEKSANLENLLLEINETITNIEYSEVLYNYAKHCLLNTDNVFAKLIAFETITQKYYNLFQIPLDSISTLILLMKVYLLQKNYGIEIEDDFSFY